MSGNDLTLEQEKRAVTDSEWTRTHTVKVEVRGGAAFEYPCCRFENDYADGSAVELWTLEDWQGAGGPLATLDTAGQWHLQGDHGNCLFWVERFTD